MLNSYDDFSKGAMNMSVVESQQGGLSRRKGRVEITYCSQCRFILRAAWMAQELLMTFGDELGEVALIPAGGGIFVIGLDGEVLWDKKVQGRYPEPKEIKQRVRDRIAPDMNLGHSDRELGQEG
jgi:selenoprotein W-related protein